MLLLMAKKNIQLKIYLIQKILNIILILIRLNQSQKNIKLNIDINCDNDVCGSPEFKAFVDNENNLEVKFDSRNSNFDSDNYKYSIDLYLIPKASGTSNLEVIFKDYNSGKQTKYLYKVTIDDNFNTTYKLIDNNQFKI